MNSLSPADTATWWTLHFNDLIDAGRFDAIQAVPTSFALSGGAMEKAMAAGPFTLYTYTARGDGSYMRDSGLFFAGGLYGVPLSLAVMAGRAVGNSHRRHKAEQDAQPRWQPDSRGTITVSQLGFYLQQPQGLYAWNWGSIDSAELVGHRQVWIQGRSTSGQISWIVESDWSELVFTMWARYMHPHHPQFLGQVWVPQGWSARVKKAGQTLPPSHSGRWELTS